MEEAIIAYARDVPELSHLDVLVSERRRLIGRLEQEEEQLETLRGVVSDLESRVTADRRMLQDIEEALGKDPQMRLDHADVRIRGRQLEEEAIRVLSETRGDGETIHYTEWFELLRVRGFLVAGKVPIDTFLAQINRSRAVEKVGNRTGIYRLADAA